MVMGEVVECDADEDVVGHEAQRLDQLVGGWYRGGCDIGFDFSSDWAFVAFCCGRQYRSVKRPFLRLSIG